MPNWLTYYFAMKPCDLRTVVDNGMAVDALVSFAMFGKRSVEELHKLTVTLKSKGKRLMLDSGAFTNVQAPGTVTLQQYQEYLREHRKCWDEYITFDDMRSREKTIRQHEHLLAAGFRPLFVDHMRMREDERVLKYWKKDDKVALSAFGTFSDRSEGATGHPTHRNPHEVLHKKAEDGRKLKTKVHLLAVSSLTRFIHHADVIGSVDSSAWGRRVGYGVLLVLEHRDVGGIKIPILAGYDQPAVKKPKRAMTKEVKDKLRAFVARRKWTVGGQMLTKLFVIEQLQLYVKALNALAPQSLVDAAKRHKAEKEAAAVTKRTYFFLEDDAGTDAWDNAEVAKHESRSAESVEFDPAAIEQALLPNVPDEELLALHCRAHAAPELLDDQHLLILQEMAKRGMPHTFLPETDLDWATRGLGEEIGLTKSELDVLGLVEKQMVVQTLILSKERFKTADAAKRWITEHGFKIKEGAPDETEDSWRFRQLEPSKFAPGSFRTIAVTDGVKGVVGRLKEEKAAWTGAYINDLPDSAFLHIGEGGKKDEDGKTVPRSLRHFPVRGADGKIDLPHLRNALARIPRSNLPQAVKDKLTAAARKLLEEATNRRNANAADTEKAVRLLPVDKADEDRRIVFGVVLEPNSVDTQGDTISAEEIERAAHLWLARYQDRGFMHRQIVNGKIELYESYIAPTNLTIGGQKVKKGTWLLMYHVLDDALWAAIKRGDLTGFSMGGFARRSRV